MPNTGVLESDVPVGTSGIHPALDLSNRVADGFMRHLTAWYAFSFYAFGLALVAYMLVPSLLANEKPKSDVVCRKLTRKVVEAAALVRRQSPTASLELADRRPVAERIGGTIPTCPDGGRVQFLPPGSNIEVDGVSTVVTSAYIAGICVRPDGERCFEGAILARVHPTEAYLDGILRPDSPNIPWTPAPKAPAKKSAAEKKKQKRKAQLLRQAGITVLK